MGRTASSKLPILLPVFALLLILSACGGANNSGITPPSPAYSLQAAALAPASLSAGTSASSTITVTPVNGYQGNITLSCSGITGGGVTLGGQTAPGCSFNPAIVPITSSAAASSTLTVSTTGSTPSAAYAISVTGKDAGNVAPSNGVQGVSVTVKFQHIVIIFQENRTPDNLFHDQNLVTAGADIDLTTGKTSSGAIVPLVQTSLGQDYDLSHAHSAFVSMCDLNTSTGVCNMDGADLISITCSAGATNCPPTNPQFMYVQQSDVQPYWDLAEQYTFADRMFQTNEGPSMPAHQMIISGTSEPSPSSPLFVSENPGGVGITKPDTNTGCTAPAGETIRVIDALGSESSNPVIYPCFEHATLTDELNTAGITWRYYAPGPGSIWTAPNAIQHMCGAPYSTACTAPDWVNNVVLYTPANPAPILSDIVGQRLQQVSWVIPAGINSDHPGGLGTTGGPSWVASIVNAIGNSAYWSNTAIVITWDDWGGWYDHVSPPKVVNDGVSWGSGYVYGFRVPMIVVSPLAKPGYISHTQHDFGSILNLVENTFDLPSMGFADAYADDLSDCFNFSQTPNAFKTVNSRLKADFFLHDRRPITGPDDD